MGEIRRARGGGRALLLAGLMLGAACTSEPKGGERAADLPEVQPLSLVPAPGSAPDETEALAAQAQRDVDAFARLRAGGALPAASPPGPPAIQWNDPPSRSTQRRPPADVAPPPVMARPTEQMAITPAPPPQAAAATAAAEAAELLTVDDLDVELVRIRQQLFRKSIDSEQPMRELIGIAAMALVDPKLELPDGAQRGLDLDQQTVLRTLHAFFVDLGRRLDGDEPPDDVIAQAVTELQARLVPPPALELPAAVLCWRVGGFGDYDRFDRTSFLAHSEQQVILYLEIEGFSSTRNEREQWVTEVSQRLEIYSDRDGIPVWSEPWQKAVDVTSKERRDFFTTQLVTLPEALSVGLYHLKIQVREEASGAEAEASIPLEMVADPKLAAKVPG